MKGATPLRTQAAREVEGPPREWRARVTPAAACSDWLSVLSPMTMKERLMDPSHHRFKEGLKRRQGSQIAEHPLHPYEEERLRQCMRNSARLKELGIPPSSSVFPNNSGNARNKKKPNNRNSEDSDPEYDPSQDDTGEGDLIGGDNAKGSEENVCKETNKRSSSNTLAGVRFRSRKRVYAEQLPIRATRTKTSKTQPDAILKPSDLNVPPPSQHNDATQAASEDDGPAQLADNTHMTNGSDAIPRPDGPNNMDNEDGCTQHDDNNIVGNVADCIHSGGHNQITAEGEEPWDRGVNMGHGLQRLNRARGGKLPIVITEGNILFSSAGRIMANNMR